MMYHRQTLSWMEEKKNPAIVIKLPKAAESLNRVSYNLPTLLSCLESFSF